MRFDASECGGTGDLNYFSLVLNPDFDGGSFTAGGASRLPNGVNTGSVADWARNDYDGLGLPGFTGTADPGEALNTPGTTNAPVPEPATMLALAAGRLSHGVSLVALAPVAQRNRATAF